MSRIVSSLRVLPLRMTKEGNSSKLSLINRGACCADQTVNDISSGLCSGSRLRVAGS